MEGSYICGVTNKDVKSWLQHNTLDATKTLISCRTMQLHLKNITQENSLLLGEAAAQGFPRMTLEYKGCLLCGAKKTRKRENQRAGDRVSGK